MTISQNVRISKRVSHALQGAYER